ISCVKVSGTRRSRSPDAASRRRDHLLVVPSPVPSRFLGCELVDTGRPVAECGSGSGGSRRGGAGAELVVSGAGSEEPSAPVGVAAGMRCVLARDPDRIPVDRGGAVVAPPRAGRVTDL